MASLSGITSDQNSALWDMVQIYMTTERVPLTRLQTARTDLNARSSTFQTLRTNLRALRSAIDDFRYAGSLNPLNRLTATSSVEAALTATAVAGADAGDHTVVISALAQAHSVAGTELIADEAFGSSGDYSFTLTQNGETTTINVSVAEGATQGEVLEQVADAIEASGAAVRATVVTSNAALGGRRLLLTSEETGTTALISEIADQSGGLAAQLGIAGTSGVGAFSANTVQEAADASFSVDGLALTASSNTVTDVLPGLTLQLRRAGDGALNLSVARDTEAAKTALQAVIDAYNTAVDFVRQQTRGADDQGENRGLFTGNNTFQALRRELRSLASEPVDGITTPGAPRRLADLGVTIDGNGRLTLSDPEELVEALGSYPDEVERLFTDETDGIAVRIDDRLRQYVAGDGAIDRELDVLATRRRTLDRSIERLEERLARREQTLLNELTALQNMIESLTQQQSMLSTMMGY